MASAARVLPNPIHYSAAFVLAFLLSLIMLVTDTNLRTDFGSMPSGYYFHWYLVLATAIADGIGAALLLLLRSQAAVKLGVLGSGLLVLLFVGVVVTYNQVGFATPSSYASYLFGVTYQGGNIRYLYDSLLAVYIGTALWGAVGLRISRGDRVVPKMSRG